MATRLVDSGIYYDDSSGRYFYYGTDSGGSEGLIPLDSSRVTPRAQQAATSGGGSVSTAQPTGGVAPTRQAPLTSLAGLIPVTQQFQGPFQGSTTGIPLPNSQGGGLSGQTNPLGSTSTLGVNIAAELAALAGRPQIQPQATPGPVTPQFVSAGPPNTLTPQQSQGLTQTYGASPRFNPTAPAATTVPQAPPGPPPGSAATPRPPAAPPPAVTPAATPPATPPSAQDLDAAIAAAAGALQGAVGPGANPSSQFPQVGGGQGYQSTFGLPIPRGGQGPQRRGY